MPYIYDLTDGHYHYIGKTNNPRARYRGHKSAAKNQKSKLYNCLRKYGIENFEMVILEEADEWEQLEENYIQKYGEIYGDLLLNTGDNGKGYGLPGELNGRSKLTWDEVNLMRSMAKEGHSFTEIGHEFGLTMKYVNRIMKNKMWYDPDFEPIYSKDRHSFKKITDMRKFNALGYTPKQISDYYGIHDVQVRTYLRNESQPDDNWDPIRRVFIHDL